MYRSNQLPPHHERSGPEPQARPTRPETRVLAAFTSGTRTHAASASQSERRQQPPRITRAQPTDRSSTNARTRTRQPPPLNRSGRLWLTQLVTDLVDDLTGLPDPHGGRIFGRAVMSRFDKLALRFAPGRIAWAAAAFALYSLTSVLMFGRALWPHPGRGIVGLSFQDPLIIVWSFAWWEHALSSFTNPFFTHAIYSPVGANLMWTPSAPGLGLVFAPLTALVGPTAAFNVAMLLQPAVGAWTAFLLCRYLTNSIWAALAGGYLFGFSSYAVAHEYGGHLNLGVYLLPLAALVLVRYLRCELAARGLAWRLGLILAFQLTISTEIALTLTLGIGIGLLLAFALVPDQRRRLASALAPIVSAYGIAAVLTAPFVYYLVAGFETGHFVQAADGDVLNIVLPTNLIALGGATFESITEHFAGTNVQDQDLYLGVPVLLIVALYIWRRRREPTGRFLASALVVTWVLALGASLRFEGHRIVALPWALADSLPLLDNVVTTRLAAYASLSASVAVALWVGSTRGRLFTRPVILPFLALATLMPATWRDAFVMDPVRPQFFAQGLYRICIPPGETLAIFPYGRFGDSMLWQAESGFWFNMAEGDLGRDTYPPRFVFGNPTVTALQFYWYGPGPRPTMKELLAFAKSDDVDRIVSLVSIGYPNGTQMWAFGPLQVIGGMYVAPGCNLKSLAGDTRVIPGQE
jgi:hypothetical protein